MDPIKVTFSIAETWYLEIVQAAEERKRRTGDLQEPVFKPLLRLPNGTLYEHAGAFDFIDNKVDESTGTVRVRAQFPNPDRLLLPGQFVTVVIEREEAVDRVLIPQAALLTDQGGAYVLAVNDEDVVQARRIETGQRFGPNLVVERGLAPGERIVLYGIQKVRPGLTVKPEPAAAPSDPMDSAAAASVAAEDSGQVDAVGASAGSEAAERDGAAAEDAGEEGGLEEPSADASGNERTSDAGAE
jgi:membrane fusion protein (multidrug efflux system)